MSKLFSVNIFAAALFWLVHSSTKDDMFLLPGFLQDVISAVYFWTRKCVDRKADVDRFQLTKGVAYGVRAKPLRKGKRVYRSSERIYPREWKSGSNLGQTNSHSLLELCVNIIS